jgi:hypothetical protein
VFFAKMRVSVDSWFDARDYFLGENGKHVDAERSDVLAAQSTHPDAVWYRAFRASNKTMARYLLDRPDDNLAVLYAYVLFDNNDIPHLYPMSHTRQAITALALERHPFACIVLAIDFVEDARECAKLIETAVDGGERSGYIFLYNRNSRDKALGIRLLRKGAEMGDIQCMFELGCQLWAGHPERFNWIFTAIVKDEREFDEAEADDVAAIIVETVAAWRKGKATGMTRRPAVYCLGKWAYDERLYDYLTSAPFKSCDKLIEAAQDYYTSCNARARQQVDAWCLSAKRLRVVKDIRRLVSNMIWADRANIDLQ